MGRMIVYIKAVVGDQCFPPSSLHWAVAKNPVPAAPCLTDFALGPTGELMLERL